MEVVAGARAMGVRGVVLCLVLVLGLAALLPVVAAASVPADAARASYDDAGRLRSFTTTDAAGGPSAPREASVFAWDPVGNLLSVDRYLASELSVIGMTPERGKVGATVEIDGTGFGSDPQALTVRYAGTTATIASASDEQLSVEVPAGASTGTVTVTKGASSATSPDPFTVESDLAPSISGVTPTIVAAGDQLRIAGSQFATTTGTNDVWVNGARALVQSATASEVDVETPPTGSGHVRVETPEGTAVGPDVFVVPDTYAVGDVEDTARLTLGSGHAVLLSAAGKVAMYVIDARANDRLRTQVDGSTIGGTVSVWSPTGTSLNQQGFASGSSTTGAIQLPVDGTYTIIVAGSGAGSATITPFVDTVQTIAPSPGGDTRTIATSFTGQDARLRFDGTAGQRIAVAVPSTTLSGWVEIAPAGTRNWIAYSRLSTGWLDVVTLPSDGSYDVWLETMSAGGGQATVTAYDVPVDMSEAVSIAPSVLRRDIRFDFPGQNQVYPFDGRAGERVELRFPSIGVSAFTTRVIDDGGATVANASWTTSSTGLMEALLPADGKYSIVVDPSAGNTGTVTMEAYDASDVVETVTPTASGVTRTLTAPYPGQDLRLRFDARAGERYAVAVPSTTLPSGYIELARAGTTSWLPNWSNLSTHWLDINTISADGSYDAWVESTGASGGDATITVYQVPDDQSESIAFSTDPVSRAISFDYPGQNAQFTFTGRAGQRATVRFPSISLAAFTSRVVDANGSTVASRSWTSTSTGSMEARLPADGTYTVVVDPSQADTGSVTMELGDASDVVQSITPTASGTTTSVRTSYTGQDIRLRFDARAGERIAVAVRSNTLSGYIEVAPAGTTSYLPNWSNLSSGWLDVNTIPSDGSYDVWLESTGSGGGSATVTVYDVPAETPEDITVSPTLFSRDLTFEYPGWNAVARFDGRAGERVMVRFPRIGLSSFKAWLLSASGTAIASSNWTSTSTGFMQGVLPADGTYRVVVDPSQANTGTATVEIADASDIVETVTPTAAGVTRTLSAPYPGQDLRLRFDARAGERYAVAVPSTTLPSGYIELARAGTTSWLPNWSNLSSHWLDINTISTDGSYDAWIESTGATGGDATITVYQVPDDQSETVTLSETALRRDIRIDYPGQGAQLVFSGTSGDVLATDLTNSTFTSAGLRYKRPDGSNLLTTTFGTSGASNQATLTSTGTHTIEIDPSGPATGSVSLAATLTSGGGTQSFSGARLDGTRTASSGPSSLLLGTDTVQTTAAPAPSAGASVATASTHRTRAQLRRLRRSIGQHRRAHRARRPHRHPRHRRAHKAHPRGSAHTQSQAPRRLRRRPRRANQVRALRRSVGQHAQHAPSAAGHDARTRAGARAPSGTRPSPQHATASPSAQGPARELRRALRRWQAPIGGAWRPTRADRHGTWTADLAPSPWTRLAPLQAPAGATALAGQVLRVDGRPLAGVKVAIEHSDASARTDRTGRFLLTGASGGRHVLVVDGRRVGGRRYGIYEIRVELAAGTTTKLPYTVWLTELDPAGDARVPVPTKRETVLTNPKIPGLEVHLPAGSRITDADGRAVRDLNLTAIAVDRPPFPLPDGTNVPAYFTAQPGRAYVSKGARIVYPNYHHLPPGQRVAFWNYDAEDRGWYVYGYGEVTADARQVVPDPGVRIWEFTGAMATTSAPAPAVGPCPGGGAGGGDPVDLGTGLFVYRKTDLNLPDAIPATLQRIYRPGDSNVYGLGRGTTTPYDLRLWNVSSYTVVQLILPDGGTIDFDRTSPGTDWQSGVFEQRTVPGPWFGALIKRMPNVDGWELHRRDGTVYEFASGYGPLTAIQDPDGNRLTIDRSSGTTGLATRITTEHGRWMRFTYNGSNLATSVVDNAGRRVSYTYDANQRLETVTDADGGTSTFTYDASGQMTAIEDARGTTFLQNRYDANGRVIEQTLADRGTYTFDYTLDTGGRVTSASVTDPRGVEQQVGFDTAGLPVQDTRAVGTSLEQTTRYERDATTNLIDAVVDPLGHRTEITYDTDANPTAITRLAGTAQATTTRYTYGTNAKLLSEQDPLGHTTSYGYDSADRLTSITDPTSRTTTIGYDGAGRQPAWIKDPSGQETDFSYVDGELRSVTDPLGRTTRRWVDSVGRVVAITDPLGRTTRAVYDDANLLVKTIDPQGGETTYRSDANGNLTAVTDARGKTVRATYDLRDKLASWTDADGRTETLVRDLDGNVVTRTDRDGNVTSYRYDDLGRRVFAGFGTTGVPGSETYDSTIDYGYDAGGRLTRLEDSAAGTITDGWDGLGRLISQVTPNGTVSYSYDGAGRRETLSLDGSPLAAYGYDDAGRLTSVVQDGQIARLAYDGVGRLDTVTLPDGIERVSTYDAAGQVTRLDYTLGTVSLGDVQYAYDPAGRRAAIWGSLASFRLPAARRSATYDDANRRTAQDATTLAWDQNGNLIDDGTDTYSWDSRDQLAAIRDASGTIATFAYDPLGRRAQATIDGTARSFVYDGWNVVKEHSSSADAILMNGLGLDQAFARTLGTTTKSVLADALGSTTALADDSGTITDEFAYGPFGESDTTIDHPFQYTGRENDGTGLYQYRNRYYSPTMKRFISEDPTGMAGSGTNYYAYAGNDPLDYTDPTGLFGLGDIAGAIDAVVPDPVSDFTAGLWDGALAGFPSRAFGIPQQCWGSAHAYGQVGGAAAGAFAFGGAVSLGARGLGAIAAGALGGAAGGAYNAAGTHINASLDEISKGAVSGIAGGVAGGSLSAISRVGGTSAAIATNTGATLTEQAHGYSVAIGTGQPVGVSVGAKDDC